MHGRTPSNGRVRRKGICVATLALGLIASVSLLAGPANGNAAALADAQAAATCPVSLDGLNLTQATIAQIRAALDSGQITSLQLVDAYLARIKALNASGPQLRAVITTKYARSQARAADQARASGQASGPLAGIPILIKDNIDTHDYMTTVGAKAMLGAPPPRDAFLVSRLRSAGAIILGKTNLDEWATRMGDQAQPHGFSDVGGLGKDPYTGADPSGSSGGSAISAASGLAASTVGTETSGSIIDPATVNSAVGIKPTLGLISRGGVVPLLEQYDSPGPIDQNVTDAAAMLGLMTGVDPRDPATRRQIGHVQSDYTAFLDPNALRGARIGIARPTSAAKVLEMPGLNQMRAALEASGATVVALRSHLLSDPISAKFFLAQFRAQLDHYLAARGPTSPRHSVAQIVAFNRRGGMGAVKYGQQQFIKAQQLPANVRRNAAAAVRRSIRAARKVLDDALRKHHLDALLVSRGVSAIVNTPAGYPAITVPAGYRVRRVSAPPWYTQKRTVSEPYGAIFTGRPWSEPKLIGYGYAFEQATKAWRSPAQLNPRFAAACSG